MFVFYNYSWSCPFAALFAEDILSKAFLSIGERRDNGLSVLRHELETA